VVCCDGSWDIQGAVADRVIFQRDKTELEDKEVLREFKECGNDPSMDSVDSIPFILCVEGENKEFWDVVYQFYIGNKDNAIPTDFPL
jgi:hypothetical protein